MLTIEEIREELGPSTSEQLSDEEVTAIRDSVHALASIFVDSVLEQRAEKRGDSTLPTIS